MSTFHYTYNRDSSKDIVGVNIYTSTSSASINDTLYNDNGEVLVSKVMSADSNSIATTYTMTVNLTSSVLSTTPNFGIWLSSNNFSYNLFRAGNSQSANDTLTLTIPSSLDTSYYYGISFANLISGNPETTGSGCDTVSITNGTIGDNYLYKGYYSRFIIYNPTGNITVDLNFGYGPV